MRREPSRLFSGPLRAVIVRDVDGDTLECGHRLGLHRERTRRRHCGACGRGEAPVALPSATELAS